MTYVAYCDPNNAVTGNAWEETRDLPITEIAKKIRQDIRAALKGGALPAGLKTSVRLERFSGGRSIDVIVTALPEGWVILEPAFEAWQKQNPHASYSQFGGNSQTKAHRDLLSKLGELANRYNRQNIDTMSDYFHVRYYSDVTVSYEAEQRVKGQ